MQPVAANNTRYILELERDELLRNVSDFDRAYGSFSLAFLTSLQVFAFFAYFLIVIMLGVCKKSRSKTNFVVCLWAFLNFFVVLEKLTNTFVSLINEDNNLQFLRDMDAVSQMLAGLARIYGTFLAVIWVYTKFHSKPHPKYDFFLYFLIFIPAFVCLFAIFTYFHLYEYIYEAFGPSCDIINVGIYIFVILIYMVCVIFGEARENSTYCLLVAFVNLITNFPIGLMTIYLRFVLDIGWVYRFHLYFADFAVNVISCSNAFVVLFLIIIFNEDIRYRVLRRGKSVYFL